jgi:hypothetical protein
MADHKQRLAFSKKEAAQLIGCSAAWLSVRIATGELPSVKIAGRRFISDDALRSFVNGRANRAGDGDVGD